MKTGKREAWYGRLGRVLACAASLVFGATLAPALAGQEITISTAVTHYVYGNGNASDNGKYQEGNFNVTDNKVIVTQTGQVGTEDDPKNVYGADLDFENYSGSNFVVSGNSVTINGGYISGDAYGGKASADDDGEEVEIIGNAVTLNDGSVDGYIYGGRAYSNNATATASANKVNITKGTVSSIIYGGYADSDGDSSCYSVAKENVVTITGGTINSSVYGGFVVTDGDEETGFATGNIVNLGGGTITGDVYGGQCRTDYNNTGGDVFTDNTLNVSATALSVGGVYNFEYLNFYVPETAADGDVMLNVTDIANITNSIVSVGVDGSGSLLEIDEKITLIEAGTLIGGDTFTQGETSGLEGVSTKVVFDVAVEGNSLVATVTQKETNDAAASLGTAAAAGIATLSTATGFAATTGVASLLASFPGLDDMTSTASSGNAYASRYVDCGWSGATVFAAIEAGSYRVDAGYSVHLEGVSGLVGLGWLNRGAAGSFAIGAFFEAGYSDYEHKTAFGETRTTSDGDSRYFGGGILGRFDWKSGAYVEGSFRAGDIRNDYKGTMGEDRVDFDTSSTYVGAHAGVGYKFPVGCVGTLDTSVKYLWTRQGSDSAAIRGERVDFESANSHRVRTGVRYSHNVGASFSPYVGAAFEYEFDGKARTRFANANVGFGMPSTKGGTGIGELGVKYRKDNFVADLGVQGHVGKRQGVSGSLKVGWAF